MQIVDLGENASGCCTVNYLLDESPIFITDNHLAAFWIWHKLDVKSSYTLIHIDRHYDLADPKVKSIEIIKETKWANLDFNSFSNVEVEIDGKTHKVIQWDNYIKSFNILYPDFFKKNIFCTEEHSESLLPNTDEVHLDKLMELCLDEKENIILNLDLDFFFTRDSDGKKMIRKYTDDYIDKFLEWLNDEKEKFKQIIICLSPECCGSWEESKKIKERILEKIK
tara:strand:+ start:27488 stop:28159 length:672 start_codon:yes stop_codon:yes gene_type:complete